MKTELVIGKVLKPRGLKGEFKFETYSGNPSRLDNLKTVKVGETSFRIEKIHSEGDFGYLKLEGVDTIEQAETLRNKTLSANRSDLPPLSGERYYVADLLGCDVYTGGENIGQLADILQYGSADVYVIKLKDEGCGASTVSVPAIKDLVESINPEEGKILLNDRIFSRIAVFN